MELIQYAGSATLSQVLVYSDKATQVRESRAAGKAKENASDL
jgi:hypothetical protein